MKKFLFLFLVLISIITSVTTGCEEIDSFIPQEQTYKPTVTESVPVIPDTSTDENSPSEQSEIPSSTSSEPLIVSVLDVGQADCIIVQHGDNVMVIDAGNNADSGYVVDQLRIMGINHLDVVIGTHPHEDHIGGLDAVINNFDIGTIYMPKVSNTTKTFEDVLLAIQKKGLSVTTPVPGSSFTLGEDVQCLILAPNSSNYDDLNNYSIVLKVTFNDRSFLFTGDAEVDSEIEILSKGFDLKSDVLKVGHHGSSSSTSDEFLQAVSPEYAVICCGVDNTYGHPHQETLDKLNAAGIKIYRTDLNGGTIKFIVDGNQLSVSVEK